MSEDRTMKRRSKKSAYTIVLGLIALYIMTLGLMSHGIVHAIYWASSPSNPWYIVLVAWPTCFVLVVVFCLFLYNGLVALYDLYRRIQTVFHKQFP